MRFVKAATRKRTALTRPSSIACDETSIATCVAPRVRISAIARARSSASGVVCSAVTRHAPNEWPTVPITPQDGNPSAPSMAARTKCAVVVLPFVPVSPMTSSANDGWPYTADAA